MQLLVKSNTGKPDDRVERWAIRVGDADGIANLTFQKPAACVRLAEVSVLLVPY